MVDSTATAPAEVRMTFGEHIEELRWRLIKSVLALLGGVVVAFVFYKELVRFIVQPHFWAMQLLEVPKAETPLLSGGYAAPLWSIMKLAFIIGLFLASPVVAYQIWRFVASGLYAQERKYVGLYGPVSFLLFAGGCAFGYLILIPYGLLGMATMLRMEEVISSQYLFADYLNLVMTLTIVTGVIFELPLAMVFCTAIGLTTWRTWWRWSRYATVGIFVAAAVLTPSPDVLTQLLMVVPLILLYALGMGLSAFVAGSPRPTAAGS
ncbi:MAG: twin-arginine translocase subunit TatC [Planctomycetes bacterium]|nr:twin-arginine translocase subunit TatC [Planctomycetota bacterium]